MPSEHVMLAHSYNYYLVALSVIISIVTSYAALDLAGRVTAAQGSARRIWLVSGATAMGLGIWSMHYIGMLAFILPIPVQYDWRIVLVSLLTAILASAAALYVVSREKMDLWRAAAGSMTMGAGIAAMHYIGMAAMRLAAMCHVDLVLLTISVVLAVAISLVALWLAFSIRDDAKRTVSRTALSAVVMGLAIPTMHYTGMAAVSFTASDMVPDFSHAVSVTILGTAGVTFAAGTVLVIAILTSVFDRRYSAQTLELARTERRYRLLFERSPAGICRSRADGTILDCNDAWARIFGFPSREELVGKPLTGIWPTPDERKAFLVRLRKEKHIVNDEHCLRRRDGSTVWVQCNNSISEGKDGEPDVIEGVIVDVTDQKQKDVASLHSQKLEAVGGLAAGIAHEINTPIQFVGDNARFVQDSFGGITELIDLYGELCEQATQGEVGAEMIEQVRKAREKVDWEYVRNEVPKALDQMLDGVNRVAKIVRSMKEFSHVDQSVEKVPGDVNRALESTLVVATNELKYVAKVEAEYGELPLVSCYLGDLNQVFLNLLVNAAHAIGDVVKNSGNMGQIRVRTRQDGEWVEIAISDTGTGIPEAVRDKVFNPFFTTKEVGKGSGQGLALARTIVVDKHRGTLTFETEMGKGTTFRVRLPLNGIPEARDLAVV